MRENQTRAREKRTGAKMKRTRGAKREESRSRSRMTRTLSSACGAMRTARPGDLPDQIYLKCTFATRSHYRYNWQWDYVQKYAEQHHKNLLQVFLSRAVFSFMPFSPGIPGSQGD